MATTVTKVANSETPYSVMFRVANDEAAQDVVRITGTQLLASVASAYGLAAGPLRETLARQATADWDELNVDEDNGDLIRIYAIASSLDLSGDARTNIFWYGGVDLDNCGLNIDFEPLGYSCPEDAAITFEIRRLHSASQ